MRSTVQKMSSVKGMNDILPDQSGQWISFESKVHDLMRRFTFENIRTPILECTQLFVKGTGDTTDIVEKEMYSFEDKLSGEQLTLRPENTPGVVRSAIEHNLTYDGGKRLYYMGPMFRHERPQRGRYRQFHQLGVECLGFSGPQIDAEVMALAHQLLIECGIRNIRLEINSLGALPERQKHREALTDYFEGHKDILDEDAKRRLYSNPLRILDTKNPALQELVSAAPQLLAYLGDESRQRFEMVQTLLTACGVAWSINPRLVRGLDYYCHTVFEFITDELGAQGTVCGGGRYDGLFESLGGKSTQGIGWGLGIERLLELAQVQGQTMKKSMLHAYVIVQNITGIPLALRIVQQLRAGGSSVQIHAGTQEGHSSMKAQFKKADASGAYFALIFGEDELSRGCVILKSLRDGKGEQREVPIEQIAALQFESLVDCIH
jgi:histidyl-tRNA synthetase